MYFDSDELEITMGGNCSEVEDAGVEAESVEEQCDVNVKDNVNIED